MQNYATYNTKVCATLGVDWYKIEAVGYSLGTAPGIYPDVALLLEQTVRLPNIRNIIEFGSGASTIYLFAAAQLLGITVRTFEEDPHWRDVTQSILREMGVAGVVELYQGFNPLILPDMIFLDCQPPLRVLLPSFYPLLFAECKMLLVDDANWVYDPIVQFLDQYKRTNNYLFNPTGRGDRTVLINALDQGFDIAGWVQSWLP